MLRTSTPGFRFKARPIFGAPSATSFKPAFPTGSTSPCFNADVSRVGNVMQSSTTESAQDVTFDPAFQIRARRNGFQMIRVDATSDATQMVDLETGGDWTLEMEIEALRGDSCAVVRTTQDPVALRVQGALPNPASFIVDLVSDPMIKYWFWIIGRPGLHESLIMLCTQINHQSTMAGRTTNRTDLHGVHGRGREVTR